VNSPVAQFRRIVAVVLLGCMGAAQPVAEPEQPAAPAPGHETEAETVARCLKEMASPDVQARRRAILVLGKYENPQADAGLLAALGDEDAQIRRSALVSFSERRGIPLAAQNRILELIADPDVHVRRIASSMLPELLFRTRLSVGAVETDGDDDAPPSRRLVPPAKADDRVGTLLNEALKDSDPTVVKNVLAAVSTMPGSLGLDRVLDCLASPDREIRVLALQVVRRSPVRKEKTVADQLAPLTKDTDETVRRELAGALSRCGAAGIPVLRTLAEDPAPAVRAEACRQLVLLEDESSPALLAKLLVDPAVDEDIRAQLVGQLVLFDGPVVELLRKLAGEGPASVRAAAIRTLGNRRFAQQAPPPDFFLALLADPQLEIRTAAVNGLFAVSPRLSEEDARRLCRSKYPDVRQACLGHVRLLPAPQAQEILLDACLDDDLDVRCTALLQLAIARIPDWEDILAQSLQDPDPRVRATALNGLGLGRSSPKAVAHLVEYLKTCDDPDTADQVRRLLGRAQRQNGTTTRPIRPVVRPPVAPNP